MPPVSAQPLGCADALPACIADTYLLVPGCMAAAAQGRGDVVWSGNIPHCGQCAPVAAKRGWFAKFAPKKATDVTLVVVEHYTPDHGQQAIGMEFFRKGYLEQPHA